MRFLALGSKCAEIDIKNRGLFRRGIVVGWPRIIEGTDKNDFHRVTDGDAGIRECTRGCLKEPCKWRGKTEKNDFNRFRERTNIDCNYRYGFVPPPGKMRKCEIDHESDPGHRTIYSTAWRAPGRNGLNDRQFRPRARGGWLLSGLLKIGLGGQRKTEKNNER